MCTFAKINQHASNPIWMMAIVTRILSTSRAAAMKCRLGVQHEATLRAAALLSQRNRQLLKKRWEVGIRIEPTPNPG
ncbi:MAG: hypothetical protein J6R73_04900 [Alistipes sp.]|nr:hypothetical protein [Alistipes sp.]